MNVKSKIEWSNVIDVFILNFFANVNKYAGDEN